MKTCRYCKHWDGKLGQARARCLARMMMTEESETCIGFKLKTKGEAMTPPDDIITRLSDLAVRFPDSGATAHLIREAAEEVVRLRNEVERLRIAFRDMSQDRDSWAEQADARVTDALNALRKRDEARAEIENWREINNRSLEEIAELRDRIANPPTSHP